MPIYVSHAAADAEAAQSLEKFLERRGQFVELDDGETALRPVTGADVVIVLLSQNFVMSIFRLRLEQRALDAWAEGRLILVKLDHAFAPVGLRDLPAVDASFEAQREFKWNEIANEVQKKLRAPAPRDDGDAAAPAGGPDAPVQKKSGGGAARILVPILLMLPGIGAIAVAVSIWLANRIGPTPGTIDDLRQGVDAFGVRYGAPAGVTEWVFAGAIALLVLALVLLVARLVAKPKSEASGAEHASRRQSGPDAVFVSYARANADLVMPVIDGAKQKGQTFWLDQHGLKAGQGWAGEIVRAIRGAPEVVVMCSQAAFDSDQVKREVYLADRYHRRLVPVFIEDATPPEDFEYFFADVQWLKLFETPEAERTDALLRVLEAA